MRTPARPRLPDGDCVFISDGRIVACANIQTLIVGSLDGDETGQAEPSWLDLRETAMSLMP